MYRTVCGIVFSVSSGMAAVTGLAIASPYQELSLDKATELAAAQGKRVAVVFVTSDKFSSCMDDALALPVLEQWRKDQVVLVRVEIEKERMAARLLGVSSVPTLVVTGEHAQRWVGCPDAGMMAEWATKIVIAAQDSAANRRGIGTTVNVEGDRSRNQPSQTGTIQFTPSPAARSGALQKQVLALSGIHTMMNQKQYSEATKNLVELCQTIEVPNESGWNGNRYDFSLDVFPIDTIASLCESHPPAQADFAGIIESLEKRLRSGDTRDAVLSRWASVCGATHQYDRLNAWHDRLRKVEGTEETLRDKGNVWLLRSLATADRWKDAAALFDLSEPSRTESRQSRIESKLQREGRFGEIKVSPELQKQIRQWADEVGIRIASLWAWGDRRSGQIEMLMPRVQYKVMKDAALLAAVRHAIKANVLTRSRLNLIKDIDTEEAATIRAEGEKDLAAHNLK